MLRSAWLFAILATVFLSEPLAAAEKPDVRAKLTTSGRLTGGSKALLVVEMTIGPGWHVNSHTPSEPYLIPTNVSLTAPRGNLSAVDLGGVGKEYAVDRAAELLRAEGIRAAIVSFAGDVRTIGHRGDGRPWNVGVADPSDPGRCRFSVHVIGDAGIATSGNYERGFVKSGVRYHHILDATTGWPARGVASATVVAATAFRAGCYSTAALLLGEEAGLALLEETRGVEGALITERGAVLPTSGMRFLWGQAGNLALFS